MAELTHETYLLETWTTSNTIDFSIDLSIASMKTRVDPGVSMCEADVPWSLKQSLDI